MTINKGAGHFEEDRPDGEMKSDFPPGRGVLMRANAEAALEPQQRRQCAWDEQQVREPVMKEGARDQRLQSPTV